MTTPAIPSDQPPSNPELALHNAVARHTNLGFRTESLTNRSAVMASGKPCNHVLHLLLTLFTCGLWAPIWILIAVTARVNRVTITVSDQGQVFYSQGSGWQ